MNGDKLVQPEEVHWAKRSRTAPIIEMRGAISRWVE